MRVIRVVVKSQQVQASVDHEVYDVLGQGRGCRSGALEAGVIPQGYITEEVIVWPVRGAGCVGRKGQDIGGLVPVAELSVQGLDGGIVTGQQADGEPASRDWEFIGGDGMDGSMACDAGPLGDVNAVPAGIVDANGDRDGI